MLLNIKQGDVIFFDNNNIYGRLVSIMTACKYSHVGIVGYIDLYDDPNEGLIEGCIVYEAISKGFVKSWYPLYWIENKVKTKQIAIKRPLQKVINVQQNCEKYLGYPYSWFDVIYILASMISLKLTNEVEDTMNELICSEAVAKVLYDSSKTIDFQKEFNKHFSRITPADLYKSKQLINIKNI